MGRARRPAALAGACCALALGGCALVLGGCAGAVRLAGTPAGELNVIRAWASALRHGQVARAAAYFALPSVFFNGPGPPGAPAVIRIRTRAQALAVNASLPCGATLISSRRRGPYIDALFRLGPRPGPGGSSCDPGAGATARVRFRVLGGRIVDWLRAPASSPAPGSAPAGPPPTTTSPATSTGDGQVV